MRRASRNSIKQIKTLRQRPQFLRVQDHGRRWVSPSVVLQQAPAAEEGIRFGITVTKKVSKSAVVRNRIRRRLRAAALDILPLEARTGDYVLIGRIETQNIPYDKLCSDLRWCLKRLDCLEGAGAGPGGTP